MSVTWKLIIQLQHLPQMISKTKPQIWTQSWWTSIIKRKGRSRWWRSIKKQLVSVRRRKRSKIPQRMSGRGNIHGSPGIVRRIWQLGGKMLNLTLKTCLKVYLLDSLPDHSREIFCKSKSEDVPSNMLPLKFYVSEASLLWNWVLIQKASGVQPQFLVW